MSPTSRALALAAAWLGLSVVAAAFPPVLPVWLGLGALAVAALLGDGVLVLAAGRLEISRQLPGRFAVGKAGEVALELRNPGRRLAVVEVFDGIPPGAAAPAMPWAGAVPAGPAVKVFHPVTLPTRGEATFRPVEVRRRSPLGFWRRRTLHPATPAVVRVYPDFEPVIRFALLAMQHRENPLGIVRRPRPGTSRDFQQLRDYRDGDPLAQIDWNATSRRQQLISRDYQEQRNQSVVFLLDTGRRMRAMDGPLPQFDHVLNAILLVAHVALRQGDRVSVKSFGGSDRWLPPVKGSHAMPVLLNHLYDYQTTAAPSDFGAAVERLLARQRRRSLVILLTNLRGEDGKELIPALQVLQARHLVLLASMRERSVEDARHAAVDGFPAALKFLAADRYALERREILRTLGALGILTLDSTAQEFAVSLANRYLDIKAAGRL